MKKPTEVVQKRQFILMTITAVCLVCVAYWGLWFYDTHKYVDMCDPFNQGGFAMGCYYGVEKDCQYLKVVTDQCRKDGKTVASGWYKTTTN